MANPGEQKHFTSWQQALRDKKLQSEELAVLEEMVQSGQADDLEAAAQLLDWQDEILDPDEHMYGF